MKSSRPNLSIQLGFSLTELLVALALAGVILGGVIGAVSSSRQSFKNQEEGASLSEDARMAMELINFDLRHAGYLGCAAIDNAGFSNAIKVESGNAAQERTGDLYGRNTNRLVGFTAQTNEAGSTLPSYFPSDVLEDTDVITVRYADPDVSQSIREHEHENPFNFYTHTAPFFTENSPVYIVDSSCREAAMFRAGPITTASKSISIPLGDLNCTRVLKTSSGENVSCATVGCSGHICGSSSYSKFTPGSEIYRARGSAYFVAPSVLNEGGFALKRVSAQDFTVVVEELIQNVESFQVFLGVDSVDPADGRPDKFVAPKDLAADETSRVTSARYELIIRSEFPYYDTARAKQYSDRPTITAGNDRFRRKLVSQTISMRNL